MSKFIIITSISNDCSFNTNIHIYIQTCMWFKAIIAQRYLQPYGNLNPIPGLINYTYRLKQIFDHHALLKFRVKNA